MIDKNLDNKTKIWLKRKKYKKYRFHPKSDHIHDLWITHDDLKTEILKILKNKIITIEDFSNHFHAPISEIKFYLDSLEQALIIKKVNEGWVITSKGNFIENFDRKIEKRK